jgi:hypothetical protein
MTTKRYVISLIAGIFAVSIISTPVFAQHGDTNHTDSGHHDSGGSHHDSGGGSHSDSGPSSNNDSQSGGLTDSSSSTLSEPQADTLQAQPSIELTASETKPELEERCYTADEIEAMIRERLGR